MPHLHLPLEHTDADLRLAGFLAGVMDSRALYVVWTHDGGANARPEVQAVLREPASSAVSEMVTLFFQAVGDCWRALTRPVAPPTQGRLNSGGAPAA